MLHIKQRGVVMKSSATVCTLIVPVPSLHQGGGWC